MGPVPSIQATLNLATEHPRPGPRKYRYDVLRGPHTSQELHLDLDRLGCKEASKGLEDGEIARERCGLGASRRRRASIGLAMSSPYSDLAATVIISHAGSFFNSRIPDPTNASTDFVLRSESPALIRIVVVGGSVL